MPKQIKPTNEWTNERVIVETECGKRASKWRKASRKQVPEQKTNLRFVNMKWLLLYPQCSHNFDILILEAMCAVLFRPWPKLKNCTVCMYSVCAVLKISFVLVPNRFFSLALSLPLSVCWAPCLCTLHTKCCLLEQTTFSGVNNLVGR